MKWLNGNRMKLVVLGIVAVIVASGGSAKADFTFGQRVNLGPVVNSPYGDYDPFIAPDGLSLYFASTRPGGLGREDIWVSTRATVSDPWGPPVHLGAPVNSQYRERGVSITADGLTLAFTANTPGGLGGWDIWLSTRPTKESPWGSPMNLGSPVNSAGDELCGCISPDGYSLYFFTTLSVLPSNPDIVFGGDIYVTTRPTMDSPWGPPDNLEIMPSRKGSGNWDPSISADGLAIFFISDYADTRLFPDIWLATRTSEDSNWGTPVMPGPEINTQDAEQAPSISADGSTLYWCSGPGSDFNQWDLWQSTISAIVDFNGDGIVNAEDMCIILDHWGTDNSLCDIGPMPWGDGIVDVEDLIVLAEHLFEGDPLKPFMGDDFESYTDTPGNIIWDTWMDFYKNNTGASIGYGEPPHAEVQIVHGGNQAMPFFYDNDGTVLDGTVFEKKGTEFYAEVQRQWAIPQDWTLRGVEVLTLWFYGEPDNSADPFYVVLEDSAGNRKEVQHPNPAAVTLERWEQWSIPIADFTGVDAATITIMGIGVGDPTSNQPGGSGLLRIDDIELHPSAGS